MAAPNEPYCGNCGYVLTGVTESSKCPECGMPLVNVLLRRGAPVARGVRYRSTATIFGMPLLAVALGIGPDGQRGHAKGFFALGDVATGVVAIGGVAFGGVCLGGAAVGVFAVGGLGIGLLTALGGAALGAVAAGGAAIGGIATGGGARRRRQRRRIRRLVRARRRRLGQHTVSFTGTGDPVTTRIFSSLQWFLGPLGDVSPSVGWIAAVNVAALCVALVLAWRSSSVARRSPRRFSAHATRVPWTPPDPRRRVNRRFDTLPIRLFRPTTIRDATVRHHATTLPAWLSSGDTPLSARCSWTCTWRAVTLYSTLHATVHLGARRR
ncbi:MAG: hypothetical protein U0575_00425 [Phycisphaerales bacterium]